MVARQSGPMKMNHACRLTDELCTRMHEWRSKKMASNCEDISSSRPFSFGLWTFMRYLTQRKQGSDGNPLRLKVCLRSTYRIRNRRVVQKLQRGVKVSDIHSGFRVVRSIKLNLLSFLPGTFSDAWVWSTCVWMNRLCLSVLGGGLSPFSNLYLQFVHEFRISSASLPIESNLCFSRKLFVCIPRVYIRVRTNTEIAFEVYTCNSQSANLPPTEARSTS